MSATPNNPQQPPRPHPQDYEDAQFHDEELEIQNDEQQRGDAQRHPSKRKEPRHPPPPRRYYDD